MAKQTPVVEPTLARLPILAGYGFIFIEDVFRVGILHMGRVISVTFITLRGQSEWLNADPKRWFMTDW